MQTAVSMCAAASDAASATHRLANSTQPNATTIRLTIADHVDALAALHQALSAITGTDSVFRSTLRALLERRDFPPGHLAADADFRRSVADLCDATEHAHIQASRADLSPAVARVRADVQRLSTMDSPAAASAPASNAIAALAASAVEQTTVLAASIHADRPADDFVAALAGATHLILSLRTAYLNEARLLRAAYSRVGAARAGERDEKREAAERAAVGRGGEIVSEILTAAADALTLAHRTLIAATDGARALAERESLPAVAA